MPGCQPEVAGSRPVAPPLICRHFADPATRARFRIPSLFRATSESPRASTSASRSPLSAANVISRGSEQREARARSVRQTSACREGSTYEHGLRQARRDLLVVHEELSPSLHERHPFRRVSTLSLQEQVQLLFHGVALLDGVRIVLPVQERDFEAHENGLTTQPGKISPS